MRMRNFGSETQEVIDTLAKRRNIYTIVMVVLLFVSGFCGIIPTVGYYISIVAMIFCGIFAGYAMYAINNLRNIKTGGRKQGGGLWWWLLLIFGLIVIPILTVVITNKITPLAEKVLGVKFL